MWLNILIAICVGVLTYGFTLYSDQNSHPPEAQPIIEAPVETTQAAQGQIVPEFSFIDINDRHHNISDFAGKIIVLNFWASWCAPCLKEFPDLLRAAKLHTDKIVFIALSSDHDPDAMMRFINKMRARKDLTIGDNVFIAQDTNTAITKDIFQTYRLPETIIIDAAQKLQHKFIGANWTLDDLTRTIESTHAASHKPLRATE